MYPEPQADISVRDLSATKYSGMHRNGYILCRTPQNWRKVSYITLHSLLKPIRMIQPHQQWISLRWI